VIGNDIVDLALAKKESNWKRKGYLDKIFTVSEQLLIQKFTNQELAIWNLWSRKEAVYKIILQKGGIRGYYPIKIECLDLNLENGKVQFENQIFYTKTTVKNKSVYSIAVQNLNDFENIKTIDNSHLFFKVDGIPFISINNEVKNVSKTHHGNFEIIVYLDA
jgi:phosphopantetheinyl transferase (holo-ACP synthase)